MSWVIIVYMVILCLELLVGFSFIVWKCAVSRPELECQLAIGGTILSVAIWMLVVLICPCFMSSCEICDVFDKVADKISHYFGKLQTKKRFKVYIHNEVYLPTTVSLLSNGHDDSVPFSEDREHNFYAKAKPRVTYQDTSLNTERKINYPHILKPFAVKKVKKKKTS